VLAQIHALQPECDSHSTIVMEYAETDRKRRFPEGLAWGVSYALRLMYSDPTLDGSLIRIGDPMPSGNSGPFICFTYESNLGDPIIKKKPCQP